MRNPFSKFFIIKCPDGTTRIVHKRVDDAFPIHFKNVYSNLKAAFQAIEKVKGEISSDFSSQIQDILIKLDQINLSMQGQFRSAYVVYQSDPCSKIDYLADEIKKITEKENINRRFQIFMDKIVSINNGKFSDEVIERLLDEARFILLREELEEKVLEKLKKVPEAISAWQEK